MKVRRDGAQWQALERAIEAYDESNELPHATTAAQACVLVQELAEKAKALRDAAEKVLWAHYEEEMLSSAESLGPG